MAAESVLEIVIRAKNEMKDVLAQIKTQVDAINKVLGAGSNAPKPQDPVHPNAISNLRAQLDGVNKNMKAMSELANTAQMVAKAFVALQLVRFITDLATAAAQDEKLSATMVAVAQSAGIAANQIKGVHEAMKQMGYSSEAAAQALTKMVRADLPVDKMEAFAKGAKDLATVAGTDAPSALNRLIFSVQNLTTRSLRQLGVTVDLQGELKKYANSHDTSVGAIDNHTKSLVMMEAVQKKLDQQSKAAAMTQGLLARQMSSLAVQTDEAKTAIGAALMPLYQVFVEEGIKLMKNLQAIGNEYAVAGSGASDFAAAIRPVLQVFRQLVEVVVKHIDVVMTLVGVFSMLKIGVMAVTGAVAVFDAALAASGVGLIIMAISALIMALGYLVLNTISAAEQMDKADQLMGNTTFADKRIGAYKRISDEASKSWWNAVPAIGHSVALYKAWNAEQEKLGAEAAKYIDVFKNGKPTMEGYVQRYSVLLQATDAVAEAQKKVEEAMKGHGKLTVAEAEAQLRSAQAARDKAAEEEKVYQKVLKQQSGYKAVTDEQVRALQEDAKKIIATGRVTQQVDKLLGKYNLLGDAAAKGFHISEAVENLGGTISKSLDIFQKKLTDTDGKLQITQGQIRLLGEKMVDAAKTPEEMTVATEALRQIMSETNIDVTDLWRKLKEKEPIAVITAAAEKTKYYAEAVKGLRDNYNLMKGVTADAAKAQSDLVVGMAAVGYSLNQVKAGLVSYKSEFIVTTDTLRAGVKSHIDLLNQQAQDASRANLARLADMRALAEAERQAIRTSNASQEAKAAAFREIDKRMTKDSLASWKSYYDELAKQRAEMLSDILATAGKIKAAEDEIFRSKLERQDKLTAIRQKGMSEEEKAADNFAQANQAYNNAEEAKMKGNLELARQWSDRAIAYNEKIQLSETATEQEKQAAANRLNQLYDQRDSISKATAEKEKKNLADQTAAYESLKATISDVVAIMSKLSNKQEIDLKVKMEVTSEEIERFRGIVQESMASGVRGASSAVTEMINKIREESKGALGAMQVDVDGGSLNAMVERIKGALRDASFTVMVHTSDGKASGGMIYGPGTGTSDSVPIWASAGEYVVRAASVAHYGPGFMDMINNMHLPQSSSKYADGGMVTTPASGGSSNRDVVDVNLNMGGQKISLMGERQQVRKLVSAFKNLQGV